MMKNSQLKILVLFIIFILIMLPLTNGKNQNNQLKKTPHFYLIQNIQNLIIKKYQILLPNPLLYHQVFFSRLIYELQNTPSIMSVKNNRGSLTIEFNDGYTIIMFPQYPQPIRKQNFLIEKPKNNSHNKVWLLNPFASQYGNRQCKIIYRIIKQKGYSPNYRENTAVDLNLIKDNLSARIIYLNTHAGYWQISGNESNKSVVIATGEIWTNTTPITYAFEYSNKMIVEGIVGDTSYISFTPMLIDYYYNNSDFNNSMIYMATCHALYDDSMATIFQNKGAAIYIGWTNNTVFWTNSLTSIWVFRLLYLGWNIAQICEFIGSGGFYNWLFGSCLYYKGDGSYQLS